MGGAEFIELFKFSYFIYGMVMTVVPMIVGYFFAKYALRLSLLNNLGSLTGAMTSTPALGTLTSVAKTDDVAAATRQPIRSLLYRSYSFHSS